MTGQEVFDDAVAASSLNNAGLVDEAVVLRNISRYQRRAFLEASRLNPEYFGKTGDTTTRTTHTAAWSLTYQPGDIAAVYGAIVKAITGTVTGVAVGDAINFVSERTWGPSGAAFALAPRATLRGRSLVGYGTDLGANDSDMVTALTMQYAELPARLPNLSTSMRLPDEWMDVVVLPLARFLAIRDRRVDEEIKALDDEFKIAWELFTSAVQVYDGATIRPVQSVPIATVSAGG
jgi:hypothetical protein